MIKKLRIGCYDYTVETVKNLGVWGYCFIPQRKIQIRQGITPKDKNITLFHEALHGIVNNYGLHVPEEMEETTVRIFENAIVKLFQDNPKFTKEFLESIRVKA